MGFREYYGQAGWTVRPKDRFFSRIRTSVEAYLDEQQDGTTLTRHQRIATGADGRFASFMRIELERDEFKVGSVMLERVRPRLNIDASPTRTLNNLSLSVTGGQEVDFDNARKGTGVNASFSGTWRPDVHTAVGVTTSSGFAPRAMSSGLLARRITGPTCSPAPLG